MRAASVAPTSPAATTTLLISGIKTKVLPLGDDVTILSGHGPATKLGVERRNNPFLNEEVNIQTKLARPNTIVDPVPCSFHSRSFAHMAARRLRHLAGDTNAASPPRVHPGQRLGPRNETPALAEIDIKRHTGIDYRKAVDGRAVRKDPAGLHQLFLFTDSNWFIGAFADDHCRTLDQLLHLWGDRAFSAELSREMPRIRKAVVSALDYDGAWNNGEYPLTYALAPHPDIKTK